jgi:hypothetical protein
MALRIETHVPYHVIMEFQLRAETCARHTSFWENETKFPIQRGAENWLKWSHWCTEDIGTKTSERRKRLNLCRRNCWRLNLV